MLNLESGNVKKRPVHTLRRRDIPLHLMVLPGLLMIMIFNYVPMAGIVLAFQDFRPELGLFGNQKWVGLANFVYIMKMPNTLQVLWNTVIIAFFKIIFGLAVPITTAILLNEMRTPLLKRTIQTAVYLPYFMSWVVLAGIFVDILSPSSGLVNQFLGMLGIKPIFFLGSNQWFRFTLVITNVWKDFGFDTVIYLAAITSIDMTLYEAARIDGANHWRQAWHVTLPGMSMVIVLLSVLSLGGILNAGFDQVFNLYNPIVLQTGDIIDTLVYRLGILQAQFGVSTAVGLFKSLVSLVFISISYLLAYKLADYRVF
jgi:putative aldouronate transport system permease protein